MCKVPIYIGTFLNVNKFSYEVRVYLWIIYDAILLLYFFIQGLL